MENFQNAGSGIKKMFIASVGAAVCAVLMVIPIVNLLAIIGTFVFGIISLVGLYGAGKDIDGCQKAFMLTIINIVISVVSIPLGSGFLGAILSIAEYVLNFMVVYLVCTSVGSVMNQIGALEAAQKGETVWKINAVCYGVMIVVAVLGNIPVLNILAAIASIVVAIAALVAAVLYMIFLNKCSQALNA